MLITFDTNSQAAYIRLKNGKVSKTREILPEVFVDFDAGNHPLGIELISPCTVTLRKVARQLKLPLLNRITGPLEELCQNTAS
jgi:uncharacterized protein YuzE